MRILSVSREIALRLDDDDDGDNKVAVSYFISSK